MANDQNKYGNDAELLIHLHPCSFSYVVISNHTIVDFRSKTIDGKNAIVYKQLNDWLVTHQMVFNETFQKIKVGINSIAFSLTNSEQLCTVSNFKILNEYSPSISILLQDKIEEELIIQYAIKKKIYRLLLGFFDQDCLCFGDHGLIKSSLTAEPDIVFAQLYNNELTLSVNQKERLSYFNKFSIKSKEDSLYYILLCYQQHGFDTDDIALSISGMIDKKDDTYMLIHDYFKNIKLINPHNDLNLVEHDKYVLSHYYTNLLNYSL